MSRRPKLPAHSIKQLNKLANERRVLYFSVEDGVVNAPHVVRELRWLTIDNDDDEYDDVWEDESPVLAVYVVDMGEWMPLTGDDLIMVAAPVRIKS